MNGEKNNIPVVVEPYNNSCHHSVSLQPVFNSESKNALSSYIFKDIVLDSEEYVPKPAGDSFVDSLSTLLTHLVSLSPAFRRGQITRFDAVKPPDISISDYLSRIHKYFGCSNECFVLSLVYIDRIVKLHKNFTVSILNIHRLLMTAVMLAAKFFDDIYYSNAFYACVGGVQTKEINILEWQFLALVNYHLFVSPREYDDYRKNVLEAVTVGIQRPLSQNSNRISNLSSEQSLNKDESIPYNRVSYRSSPTSRRSSPMNPPTLHHTIPSDHSHSIHSYNCGITHAELSNNVHSSENISEIRTSQKDKDSPPNAVCNHYNENMVEGLATSNVSTSTSLPESSGRSIDCTTKEKLFVHTLTTRQRQNQSLELNLHHKNTAPSPDQQQFNQSCENGNSSDIGAPPLCTMKSDSVLYHPATTLHNAPKCSLVFETLKHETSTTTINEGVHRSTPPVQFPQPYKPLVFPCQTVKMPLNQNESFKSTQFANVSGSCSTYSNICDEQHNHDSGIRKINENSDYKEQYNLTNPIKKNCETYASNCNINMSDINQNEPVIGLSISQISYHPLYLCNSRATSPASQATNLSSDNFSMQSYAPLQTELTPYWAWPSKFQPDSTISSTKGFRSHVTTVSNNSKTMTGYSSHPRINFNYTPGISEEYHSYNNGSGPLPTVPIPSSCRGSFPAIPNTGHLYQPCMSIIAPSSTSSIEATHIPIGPNGAIDTSSIAVGECWDTIPLSCRDVRRSQ